MLDRVCSKAWAINAELCTRLAWFSTTPLGVPVDPEVYCRKASVSPCMSGILPALVQSLGHVTGVQPGKLLQVRRFVDQRLDAVQHLSVVSATLASASSAIAWMRSSERFRRGG